MNGVPVIAVLDAGKTNKKVFLFDEQYRIVYEQNSRFDEITDEDGFPCEDVQLLASWVKDVFKEVYALDGFSVRAMNFSTYGASLVHIDEHGTPFLPLYNYLKPYPPALKNIFFDTYGGAKQLSMVTASPVLDSLNAGMQLYRLKYEKGLLDKGGCSLHLPQYLSYLVTGKKYTDMTSVGCHTMMWDFGQNNYHSWVYEEKIDKRLAPLFSSQEAIPAIFLDKKLPVGVGLHDSSAALIPYLSAFHQPFILISTGTWCISLNPFNNEPLTSDELEQDCLSYISYSGKAVKASRIFAGNEHERFIKLLADHFNTQENYYETVVYQRDIVDWLQQHVDQSSGEHAVTSASAFRTRELAIFRNYEEAYHQLMMDIMCRQKVSTGLLMRGLPVKRIFVDGGFAKNPIYMNLLAQTFPELEVYAASVSQATAMGAALAIHHSWNTMDIPSDMVSLKYYASSPENTSASDR